jgi:hypothetical protein
MKPDTSAQRINCLVGQFPASRWNVRVGNHRLRENLNGGLLG